MLRLEIDGLSKSYGGREVLRGCTYSFRRGVYSLMGPNGSGKSTLLRLCALLERPDGGTVRYLDGEGVQEEGMALKRRITLVLPRAGIFNTSVYGNVAYGLRLRGVSRDEADGKVLDALQTVGLLKRAAQNALTISSGEAQRLAIARAMVIEPEVLFLDEPTASVDEENTAIIEDLICGMRRSGSPTVIMATHDREQALRLSDSIISMSHGSMLPEQAGR